MRSGWLRVCALTVVASGFLAGCGPGGSPGGEQSGSGSGSATRVAFNWSTPLPDWTGPMLARERKMYADAGRDVEFQFLKGSTVSVQTVGAGRNHIGFAGPETFLNGVAEGLPLVAVGALFQTTPTGVITRSDSGINTLEDLEGRKVSSAQEGPEPSMLTGQLAGLGKDEDAVEFVYVDPQAKCTVMLAGRTDACTGFDNFQLATGLAAGEDLRFIPFSTKDRPILGHVIFTTRDFLESDPEAVRGFLAATCKGYKAAVEDEPAMLKLWTDEIVPKDDPKYVDLAMKATHSHLRGPTTKAHVWGWMDPKPWNVLQDMLVDGDILDEKLPAGDLYTNEHLPARDTCDFG